jgi:hypothetical protein
LADVGANSFYGVHNANIDNSVRAVMERVFFVEDGNGGFTVPPQPHPKAFACDLRRFRRLLKYKIPSTVRLDEDQFLATYTGRKLKIYQEAVESLTVREITRKDSYVAPFVKAEKIDFTRKSDPAPRIISPRSPRYNVELGMFIKPLEHSIYYAIDEVYGTRTVMKGLNAVDRGEAIRCLVPVCRTGGSISRCQEI